MISRTEFGKVFAYLAAAYPKYKYTKMTISVYYDTLSDLDDAALKLASKKCVSELKWFPSASELRRLAYSCGHIESSADRKRRYAGSIALMNKALAYRRGLLEAGPQQTGVAKPMAETAKRLTAKGGGDVDG